MTEAARSVAALAACEAHAGHVAAARRNRDYRRCATRAAGADDAFATANSRMLSNLAGAATRAACRGRVLELSGIAGTLGVHDATRRCAAGSTRRGTELLAASRSIRGLARETLRLARAAGLGPTCKPQPARPAPPAAPEVALIEADRAAADEAVGGRDLRDDVVRHAASVVTAITARSLRAVVARAWRPTAAAEMLMPVLAEARADAADHAGDVGVAEQRQVRIVDLQVEALAPGLEQMRAVQLAERRADDAHLLVALDERDADEVGVVARAWSRGARRPRSRAPRPASGALTRLTSSSVRPANRPVRTDEREQAGVALGDPAQVLDLDALDACRPARAAIRPSRCASGTNGPSTSMSSALTAGMLTAVETTPPVRAATTCSAVCTPARSCASAVEAPRCGVTTTFG